ncbi:MAG: Rrf2 family transcriptional regulator [Planctomycetota bacterium]
MFHVSTKSRYGLRTLIDLASRGQSGPVSLKELSKDQAISKKYLENIFRMLMQGGMIRSVRGARGGYQLAVDPTQVTLLEILNTIDGPVALLECIHNPDACKRMKDCPTQNLWRELEESIISFLKKRTLKELIDQNQKNRAGYQGMYI